MKFNRRKLQKLIIEELRKLNEAPNKEFMEEVLEALNAGLEEPYLAKIEGDKIICYAQASAVDEPVFEVIFK